ncbi:hypothetical protein FB451DRAFT_1185823 [Mycena latifolia]|nr:hypothetical protein FB451DRAFT_1185823 [Mycena latifolia]
MSTLHVGSMLFDIPLEVEEGGVDPLEFFEASSWNFYDEPCNDIDSENDSDSDISSLELAARALDTVDENSKDDHGQLFGPGILTSAMEGSIHKILREELKPTPAYNADMGAKERRDAQPCEDPVDPSPLIVPTSAEPNCAACADADLLNEHGKTDSEYLNWSTQLPGILFKMNSGLEHFFMPDRTQGAREIFIQDFNDEV